MRRCAKAVTASWLCEIPCCEQLVINALEPRGMCNMLGRKQHFSLPLLVMVPKSAEEGKYPSDSLMTLPFCWNVSVLRRFLGKNIVNSADSSMQRSCCWESCHRTIWLLPQPRRFLAGFLIPRVSNLSGLSANAVKACCLVV